MAPLRPPHLGTVAVTDCADTLPSELRGYFLDVKPGYTTDPTRAFYNHVWIVGDAGQISVEQQAEVNEIAELAKIGMRNERGGEPRTARREQGITVEDIRALAGPATPHFSLQIRNRIERLIEPFPPGNPVRLEGERQIARCSRSPTTAASRATRSGSTISPKSGWHRGLALEGVPGAWINVYLAEDVLIDAGRQWDRRRIFAELKRVEISELALTHVHPDHQGCAKWSATPARAARLPRRRRRRDGGPRSVGSGAALCRIYDRIWTGPPHKVDRVLTEGDESPAFASSTLPATRRAR